MFSRILVWIICLTGIYLGFNEIKDLNFDVVMSIYILPLSVYTLAYYEMNRGE